MRYENAVSAGAIAQDFDPLPGSLIQEIWILFEQPSCFALSPLHAQGASDAIHALPLRHVTMLASVQCEIELQNRTADLKQLALGGIRHRRSHRTTEPKVNGSSPFECSYFRF